MTALFTSVSTFFFFFFFNDTATTEIYTLSLHDALPISVEPQELGEGLPGVVVILDEEDAQARPAVGAGVGWRDRKSTRLNSSHSQISYAVFCLKKKKKKSNMVSQSNAASHETS